jgi:hypothetical protein
MGSQNCPGATGDPMEEATLIATCQQTCAQRMALISLVDPASCDSTIQTLSGLSPEFDDFCQNGFPSTTSSTAASSSASGSGSSSSGGGMLCPLPDTTPPSTCTEACSDLYDCGGVICNGSELCAGFDGTAMQKADFMMICEPQCNMQPAVVIPAVDPADCGGTIATFQGASPQFAQVCANGPP